MKHRTTPENITVLWEKDVFVFGSNLLGIHGKYAAKTAMKWGARWGKAAGLSGQTYAIPTVKTLRPFVSMPVPHIKPYVDDFIECAKENPDSTFLVTPIGCGSAGHSAKEIAPLFSAAVELENVHLPESFWKVLS